MLLSIGPLGTNFSEILIKIHNHSFTNMHLKISSAKLRPFCPGGDQLKCNMLEVNVNYVTDKTVYLILHVLINKTLQQRFLEIATLNFAEAGWPWNIRHWTRPSSVQVIGCRLCGALTPPPYMNLKTPSANDGHFVLGINISSVEHVL